MSQNAWESTGLLRGEPADGIPHVWQERLEHDHVRCHRTEILDTDNQACRLLTAKACGVA